MFSRFFPPTGSGYPAIIPNPIGWVYVANGGFCEEAFLPREGRRGELKERLRGVNGVRLEGTTAAPVG